MNYSAIIVAAGMGQRTGLKYNKVFYKIDEKTVIEHSIELFEKDEDCKEILLVIREDEQQDFRNVISNPKVKYVFGGMRRQDSVYNGLKVVKQEYVFIHDGARPFLKKKYVDELKDVLKKHDAALLMVQSIDTLKMVENGLVKETLDRKKVYNAQTPQVFKTSTILSAYNNSLKENRMFTDDVQVVEEYGNSKIALIEGDYDNIKITTKADIYNIK